MAHDKEIKQQAKKMLLHCYPRQVAESIGIPLKTVYNWLRELASEERERKRKDLHEKLKLFNALFAKYSEILLDPKTVESASPRDAAVVLGILQDKLFKLEKMDALEYSEEAAERILRKAARSEIDDEMDELKRQFDNLSRLPANFPNFKNLRPLEDDFEDDL